MTQTEWELTVIGLFSRKIEVSFSIIKTKVEQLKEKGLNWSIWFTKGIDVETACRALYILEKVSRKYDLAIESEQKIALDSIHDSYIVSLRDKGLTLAENVGAAIYGDRIDLALKGDGEYRTMFASEVTIYTPHKNQEAKIAYGSSGSFDLKNKVSYWKTLHAAEVLKNWDIVIGESSLYCLIYYSFVDLCYSAAKK